MSRDMRIAINVAEYGTIYVNSTSEAHLSICLEDDDGETQMNFELSEEESQELVDSIGEIISFIEVNR